jgi:hypothetical protein
VFNRYISNIILYLGAADERTEGDSVSKNAVLRVVSGLEGRGHVNVTDNYFTSPSLFLKLMSRGFWGTRTVRKSRHGFPSSLAGFSKSESLDRGELVVRMHQDRNMCAIVWFDSKPVWLLSCACNPLDPTVAVGQWVGRRRVQFPTSPILLQYQSNMHGVDLVDQQR